jgi:hypothetical protein
MRLQFPNKTALLFRNPSPTKQQPLPFLALQPLFILLGGAPCWICAASEYSWSRLFSSVALSNCDPVVMPNARTDGWLPGCPLCSMPP